MNKTDQIALIEEKIIELQCLAVKARGVAKMMPSTSETIMGQVADTIDGELVKILTREKDRVAGANVVTIEDLKVLRAMSRVYDQEVGVEQ